LQKAAGIGSIFSMTAGKTKNKSGAVAVNKKAHFNYELLEKFEAGIKLVGTEVKSLRDGQADLQGSYARLEDGQCWLYGTNIAPYKQASYENHEPLRRRKLLMHKSELRKIQVKLDQRGFTLVPLKIYFNSRGLAKVQMALAKGKHRYDKRKAISEREQKKRVDKELKKYRH